MRVLASSLLLACLTVPPLRAAEPAPDPETDPDLAVALRVERAFQKVAQRVRPSVVTLMAWGKGDWDDEFPHLREGAPPLNPDHRSSGSGVVLEADGTILTNEHVVRGAERIRVTLADGSSFLARLAGSDVRCDLAVLQPLKPVPAPLTPVVLADSDKITVGQWTLAVGSPFDLPNTLTVGHVSARGRSLPNHSPFSDVFYGNLIQTDAAINPGNSGGPLFSLRGELIGINTVILSHWRKSEGFGFAIPANDVKLRLPALKAGRPVVYGWLGVRLKDLEPGQEAFAIPAAQGVLIESVLPDTPADRAGLKAGAVILSFDGLPVASADELIHAVGSAPAGKDAVLGVHTRDGKTDKVRVRLGHRPNDLAQTGGFAPPAAREDAAANEFVWRGMQVRELPEEEARKAGGRLQVVRVFKGSPADRAGLYEGAFLDEIKYGERAAILPLKDLAALRQAAGEAQGAVYIHSPVLGYAQLDAEEKH